MSECKHCGRGKATPSGAVSAAHIQSASNTEVRSWTSLPLLDVTNVPRDLDLICGSTEEYQSWRIPASYFLGGALNATKYNVPKYIDIEYGQVKPVYFENDNEYIKPAVADSSKNYVASDIAITSDQEQGTTTIMKNGYYTFSRPHMYEIGKTYYLSQTNAGEVVSVRPSAGTVQPLFTVVDQLTISINVTLL